MMLLLRGCVFGQLRYPAPLLQRMLLRPPLRSLLLRLLRCPPLPRFHRRAVRCFARRQACRVGLVLATAESAVCGDAIDPAAVKPGGHCGSPRD